MSPSSTARGVSSRIQFNKLCIRAGRDPCGRLIYQPRIDRTSESNATLCPMRYASLELSVLSEARWRAPANCETILNWGMGNGRRIIGAPAVLRAPLTPAAARADGTKRRK